MAIIATIGSADANSYVTLAEATAYFLNRLHSDDWVDWEDSADDPGTALVTASSMLDWYMKWKGTKTTSTQSMQWPRTGAERPDGTEIDSNIIPSELKVAVFELALISLEEDRTLDNPLAGLNQIKAGSLMIKAEALDSTSTKRDVIPEKVKMILSDILSQGGSMAVVRLMRG
jgi:hypothetical protein